ncbi:MAG: methyltransferase [Cryobacterium sp.]|nr:methyltransferase [Oligoflexia bacterium]
MTDEKTTEPANSRYKINPEWERYPLRKREVLQAWDAADELILEHLATLDLNGKRLLVVNDSFGALATAVTLAEAQSEGDGKGSSAVESYTDSFVSAKAADLNSAGKVLPFSDLARLSGHYDVVLVKIPKSMAFFEEILRRLSHHLSPGAKIISGYAVKHQANSSFDLLAKFIGPTTTSLAKKKARLIFCQFEKTPASLAPAPDVKIEGFKKPFQNLANVFSRDKLDIGTRFFLDHLPDETPEAVLDIGCGNGIVGIAAKLKWPKARVIFTDDSWMAVESARLNFARYFPGEGQASSEFHWTNGFEAGAANSVDLVLCNPPFHQGSTIGDFIASQMFRDAHQALEPGGRIRVIGNSHLKIGDQLRRTFRNVAGVAKNHKFTIFDSLKADTDGTE